MDLPRMHDELAAMAREGPARRADICQRLRALLGRELTREQIVSSKLGTLVNSIRKNPALSVPDDEDDGCRLAEQLLLHWKPVMLGGGRPKDPPPADGPASLPSSPLLDGKRAGGAEADDGTAKRSKPTSALPSPRLITQAEFDEAVRDFCPDHDTRAKSFLMFLKALQVDDDDLDNGDKNDSGPTSNTESSHKESSHKESSNKEPSNKEPSNKGLTPTQASTFTHGSTSTHGSTFTYGSTPAQASGLLRLPDELTLATAHAIEGGLFHACGAEASTQYKQQVRAKYLNLSHRTQGRHLRQALLDGSLKATAFCTMTSQEMASEDRKRELQAMRAKNLSAAQAASDTQAETDQFKCGRCHQRRCKYYQLQTRSADEPMTTFVTCTNCGNRWKFC